MKIENGKVNYKKTIKDIFEFAKKFKNDIPENLSSLSLIDYYNHVKNIPYVSDGFHPVSGNGLEILHRPSYLLNGSSVSCDCDDKTVLVGAYCEKNNIPWAIAVSGKNEPEHVFPILMNTKKGLIFDATYPENELDVLYPRNPGYLEVFVKNGK